MPGIMPTKHVRFSKYRTEYPPRVVTNSSSPSSPSSRGPITPPSYPNPLPMYDYQMKQPQQSHIHHLLVYSSRPSLNYDVSLPVSTVTTRHSSLSTTVFNEPALDPPVASLKLITTLIPWSIHVNASNGYFVTVADVLNAIYRSLRTNITPREYSMLPSRSDTQQVNEAYEYRYRRVRDYRASVEEKQGGVKRVDFLRRRTRFMGLSPSKNSTSFVLNLN
ncbi:hypothetical protein Moror_8173 [Moniliophthora roreri MCA 2997]|uniref:DUF6699 domain-containing protein n=2 Tax=Moniliophthora roreri TaxID=221103 RepID=V2X5F9_MONRO|nr:hypothetical protein Moror_8173 [Moniliophthora roreri MCA 2997]